MFFIGSCFDFKRKRNNVANFTIENKLGFIGFILLSNYPFLPGNAIFGC